VSTPPQVGTNYLRRKEMSTGNAAGSQAGKQLSNPKSTKAQKKVAASDLRQVPKKKGKN
jgi:hypothetical protein